MFCDIISSVGGLAQLGEHLPYKQRVTGSSPVVPTKQKRNTEGCSFFVQYNPKRGLEPRGGTKRKENSPVDCF